MSYLLIGLILLIVIAPIFAILPSKRQKAQMALRREAMGKGFQVDFARIDDPDPDPEKYISNTGKPLERVMQVVAYRYARPRPSDWRQLPRVDWCLVRRAEPVATGLPAGWDWEGEVHPSMSDQLKVYFTDNLVSLPNDVVRVDEESYVISVYWNENGDRESLKSIMDFVIGCSAVTPFTARSVDD